MHNPSDLKPRTLEDALWETALEAAGTLEIHPTCALSLRAWITIGVNAWNDSVA